MRKEILEIFSKQNIASLKNEFSEEEIPKLRYGMIHSSFGKVDGVSIVMKQLEGVLHNQLKVPLKNIRYLVGKSDIKSRHITENIFLWNKHEDNVLMLKNYSSGYGGGSSERIELAISSAKEAIERWIKKNKIDILIAHNTSHPENFVGSVALSRYYRDSILSGKKTPKYILWWHDSHLEREFYLHPAHDVGNYLLQGVPGSFVEYVIFINSLQFKEAKKYFKKLTEHQPDFYKNVRLHHNVIYNTTDTFIDSFNDLEKGRFNDRVDIFMADFKVKELLNKNKVSLSDTFFVLQHTRMVERKRIDFALKYSYELFTEMKKKNMAKAFYFFISGHSYADGTKEKLVKLNKEFQKEYNTKKFFLVFAEDFYERTKLSFEDYPKIFAELGAISTYFSDVEGFGNNLLEVLASGLIPAIYKYPVYKKDIAKYKFRAINFSSYEIPKSKIRETLEFVKNKKKRMDAVNHNLEILKKNFSHNIMASELKRAITSKRTHI